MFIGFSFPKNNLLFNIRNNTIHTFISEKTWEPGVLFHTKKLPDLIVIFNSAHTKKFIKEAKGLKIPIIYFGNLFHDSSMYFIPGSYKKIISVNIYSLLLTSLLKINNTSLINILPKILTKKNFNKKKLIFQQSKYKNLKQRYNDYKKI